MARVFGRAVETKSIGEKIDRRYIYIRKNSIQVRKPASLTKSSVVALKPPIIKDDIFWYGSVLYIVHSIISQTKKEKFKNGNKTKGFVALRTKDMEKIMGNKTSLIIKTLIGSGIIETDNSYAVSNVSKGYRLGSKYKQDSLRFVTITDQSIIDKVNDVKEEKNKKHRLRLRKYAHLVKWFLDGTLVIDQKSADTYLQLYAKRMKRNFNTYGLSTVEKTEAYNRIDDTVKRSKGVIEKWNTPKLSVDPKAQRFFSPLTSILGQLRYFLTHEGQELVYLDIKNSQPFHMLALLNPAFWKDPKKKADLRLKNLNPDLDGYLRTTHKMLYDTTIMFVQSDAQKGKNLTNKGLRRKPDTSLHFAHEVATGKLYRFISEQLRGKFIQKSGYDPFETKESSKQELIKLLYFDPKQIHSPSKKYFAEFDKLFPTVGSVINLLKKRRHNDFAILLQQIEAKILLKLACKKIYDIDSNIPMYTIHDGIMTTKKNEKIVEEVIRRTYKEIIGIEPELSREIITPDKACKNLHSYVTKKTTEILKKLGKPINKITVTVTIEDIEDLKESGLCFKDQHKDIPIYGAFIDFPLHP